MSSAFRLSKVLLPVFCITLGACGAVIAWGRSSDKQIQLSQKLMEFNELSVEQKDNIQKSYSLYKLQPEKRRTEIADVFEQTQKDPHLRHTMDHYFAWWSSLSQNDRESFRELTEEESLEFVKTRWSELSNQRQEISVTFTGPPSVRLPALHLTFEEFSRIISEAVPPEARDSSLKNELAQLTSGKHKALRLTLSVFDSFQNQGEPGDIEAKEELVKAAILKNIRDEEWTSKFRSMIQDMGRKPFARPWLFMTLFTILDKATIALGDDLRKQFDVDRSQIIDAFASLPDKTDAEKSFRRALMTMPPEEARKRLELLAQTVSSQSPEEQLLTRYNRFTQQRQAFLRGSLGFSGPGGGSDRPPRSPEGEFRPRRNSP